MHKQEDVEKKNETTAPFFCCSAVYVRTYVLDHGIRYTILCCRISGCVQPGARTPILARFWHTHDTAQHAAGSGRLVAMKQSDWY